MTDISGKTQVLALFGDPVTHSLSPMMHNGWIADHGLDAVYVALPLKSDNAEAFFRMLGQAGFKGANITVPHKEAAARAAGFSGEAANVLACGDDRALQAFNTDGDGFLDSLDESVPNWRSSVDRALVLGAGGAAKGIAQALVDAGKQIVIANRTQARAEAIAKRLEHCTTAPWEDLGVVFGEADLIVNATTLGLGGSAAPDWPVEACKSEAIVCDIVYKPLETGLLKQARARGLKTVDGLGMLIHQGARSFEIWFGVKPDAKVARVRLLAALEQ